LINRIRKLETQLADPQNLNPFISELELSNSPTESTEAYSHTVSGTRRINIHDLEKESLKAIPHENSFSKSSPHRLSVATIRDIEKHYKKGVGIRIGPLVESSLGLYDVGKGNASANIGFMSDFILSPSLSTEVGFKYSKRYYEIDRSSDFARAISEGDSLRALRQRRTALDYVGVFGATDGDWTTDAFIEAVYRDLRPTVALE
jgi:hypothetical protein